MELDRTRRVGHSLLNGKGTLTNREFLNLPELRYTPFRKRLIEGFQLKSDSDVRTMRLMRNDSVDR